MQRPQAPICINSAPLLGPLHLGNLIDIDIHTPPNLILGPSIIRLGTSLGDIKTAATVGEALLDYRISLSDTILSTAGLGHVALVEALEVITYFAIQAVLVDLFLLTLEFTLFTLFFDLPEEFSLVLSN